MTNHERENYSWGVIQDMIESSVITAFKIKAPPQMPSKKEIKKLIKETVKRRVRT
jgi:hypothetical protein